MDIEKLKIGEHRKVLENLLSLVNSVDVNNIPCHTAGIEYTSLMKCFLLHNASAGECLLRLLDSYTTKFFPTTVGYIIVRPMFEVDVTAHYISQEPSVRSSQYISFSDILRKKQMEACRIVRESKNISWRDAESRRWNDYWVRREQDVDKKYNAVRQLFEKIDNKGKRKKFHTWSGKRIKQMAVEVDHKEAYDIFYADLSSFTHADVCLADRFLRIGDQRLTWSRSSNDIDVEFVLQYAATFLTCFLKLFGEKFGVWSTNGVMECWNVKKD